MSKESVIVGQRNNGTRKDGVIKGPNRGSEMSGRGGKEDSSSSIGWGGVNGKIEKKDTLLKRYWE